MIRNRTYYSLPSSNLFIFFIGDVSIYRNLLNEVVYDWYLNCHILFCLLINSLYTFKKVPSGIRFFNWLPWLLICIYLSGLYFSFFLNGGIVPTSFWVFSPYWYNFSLIGILLAAFVLILIFLAQFRRNETKKIWIDILFFWFVNSLIVLWIFLVLWDNFVWKPYTWPLHITALTQDSALVKYWWVYPIWIFLSLGALAINLIVTAF